MRNLFDIKGKAVVLTGGCGILGRNIAHYLVEQGAKVVVLDRVEEQGKELEAELNKMPTYVRAARAFLRELWSFCHESAATFCFVLTGLSKYYEVVTGESVELRIAKNNARSKNRPQKPVNHQPVQFGNLGEFLESAGLKK